MTTIERNDGDREKTDDSSDGLDDFATYNAARGGSSPCPDCEAIGTLIRSEGCRKCLSCGWSAC